MGLFTDMDGTISEIVPHPQEATVSQSIKSLLERLSHHWVVAVVTGRSARDAQKVLGAHGLVYLGNHGLERLEGSALSMPEEVKMRLGLFLAAKEAVRAHLSGEDIIFEDKGPSFALHYRHAPDPEAARLNILRALEDTGGQSFRVVGGKYLLNVLPAINYHKGTAVAGLIRERSIKRAIVMGDDVTDIDAFRAVRALSGGGGFRGLAVAVKGVDVPQGLEEEADYTLYGVREVEAFLQWLAKEVG